MVNSTKRYLLPRSAILKKSNEIRAILQRGKKISGRTVNIYRKSAEQTRFAVLTPKRIGIACRRNRMKRLVREIYRKNPSWFEGMITVILIRRFHDHYASLEKEIGQMVMPK